MGTITKRITTVICVVVIIYGTTLLYLFHQRTTPPPTTTTTSNNKNNHYNNNNFPPSYQQHGQDTHTDFIETDEVIIVLGYRLHDDGMPRKILLDRVDKAVQVYKNLMDKGHHPLVIVSGKGKQDIGITEAEVMQGLAWQMGVRKDDILIDHDSTNTIQNAVFSASLLYDKKIHEVFVVTSDYHMLRAQYIFQTVFPSNISLGFVASETSPEKREEEKPVERIHMKYHFSRNPKTLQICYLTTFITAEEDFIRMNLLDDAESYGYHPLRNLPRWRMIEREINDDFREFPPHNANGRAPIKHPANKKLSVVDYGSNYGYFSLQLAQKFPDATVVSLEGEAWKEYNGAADFHTLKMRELHVKNNYLCRTLVEPSTFGEIRGAGQVYDYQLSLSVFHWFVPMNTRDIFEETLSNHLLNARTTFIELPEARVYSGDEGQHMWKRISVWYNGRDEEEVIAGVAKRYNIQVQIKTLGAIVHQTGTVRKLIRVDVLDNTETTIDVKTLINIYKCKEVPGGE